MRRIAVLIIIKIEINILSFVLPIGTIFFAFFMLFWIKPTQKEQRHRANG